MLPNRASKKKDVFFDIDLTCNEPPPEVVEQYGESMQSEERQVVAIVEKSVDAEQEPKVQNEGKRWVDSRLVDLARGVPFQSLQQDHYKIRGQNFVCLSFLFSDQYSALHCGDRIYRGDLIKVRGVFKTRENADRFIRETLIATDPHSHVILAKMFQWTTLEDNAEDDETLEEKQEVIESALRGYFENENQRMMGLQRRMDIVSSECKERARETSEFYKRANEERAQEEAKDKRDKEWFEANCDKEMSLSEAEKLLHETKEVCKSVLIRLEEDAVRIPSQSWCCVSYITPKEYRSEHYPNENLQRPIIKVRGIFATRAEAETHIRQRIQMLDPNIDISLIPCWKWAGLEDDSVEDREYMDAVDSKTNLKETIVSYLENNNNVIMDRGKRIERALSGGTNRYDASLVNRLKTPDALSIMSANSNAALTDVIVEEDEELREEEEDENEAGDELERPVSTSRFASEQQSAPERHRASDAKQDQSGFDFVSSSEHGGEVTVVGVSIDAAVAVTGTGPSLARLPCSAASK